jgi:hypothetical protein
MVSNFIKRSYILFGYTFTYLVQDVVLSTRSAIRPTHGGIILFNLVMIEIEAIFESDHPTQ